MLEFLKEAIVMNRIEKSLILDKESKEVVIEMNILNNGKNVIRILRYSFHFNITITVGNDA